MQYFWNDLEVYSKNTALISEQETVSYEQLSHLADRITEEIPERSLVFLICRNQVAAVAGYVAFLRKRVAAVLLGSALDGELFGNLLRIYKPQFIWCPNDFMDGPGIYCYGGYKLISMGNDRPEMNDQLAVLVTTSGSTGSPKLVRLSYQNIQTNTGSIAGFLEIAPEDKAITTLPMHYVYGLSIIQSHLMAGAGIILTERNILDRQFWEIFKRYGATTFGAVPYIYQMLDKLHFLNMELPSLRYVTQSGGRLGKDLHYKLGSAMLERGKKFIAMYGASEATARMSYLPFDMTLEKAGSIGIAVPGGRFELVDSNGNIIPENEASENEAPENEAPENEAPGNDQTGELVYYGANVMLGYARNREDLAHDDEMRGRLATGDLARRDRDGFYYIVGRKNRFVKVFGNRVNLAEVEELLISAGYDAACTGEEDHIHIFTTSKGCREIAAYISKKTGLDSMAFTVTEIAAIPRNQAGKILYSQLQPGAVIDVYSGNG